MKARPASKVKRMVLPRRRRRKALTLDTVEELGPSALAASLADHGKGVVDLSLRLAIPRCRFWLFASRKLIVGESSRVGRCCFGKTKGSWPVASMGFPRICRWATPYEACEYVLEPNKAKGCYRASP